MRYRRPIRPEPRLIAASAIRSLCCIMASPISLRLDEQRVVGAPWSWQAERKHETVFNSGCRRRTIDRRYDRKGQEGHGECGTKFVQLHRGSPSIRATRRYGRAVAMVSAGDYVIGEGRLRVSRRTATERSARLPERPLPSPRAQLRSGAPARTQARRRRPPRPERRNPSCGIVGSLLSGSVSSFGHVSFALHCWPIDQDGDAHAAKTAAEFHAERIGPQDGRCRVGSRHRRHCHDDRGECDTKLVQHHGSPFNAVHAQRDTERPPQWFRPATSEWYFGLG
jgi:hypothetical protein